MFDGRKLIIATKHGKEKVIAPILEQELGVFCITQSDFDTDIFGTFTGEIERRENPILTVRQKCLKAMELYGCDLGIASEGSFGPHPYNFLQTANEEFLIFIDQKNNLEILAREISTETNFNHLETSNENELLDFANKVNFPSHGLIMRSTKDDNKNIVKGIHNLTLLKSTFYELSYQGSKILVETDMRAMHNPSRMEVIAKATDKLIAKIKSKCPSCAIPGFSVTNVNEGLPCKSCGTPTSSTLSFIYSCSSCGYSQEELYPHKKTTEDPQYCYQCNP